SLSGLRGGYGHTAYAASKFALIGFTHCLAVEAIKHNVRVNAVCPGFVDTEMGYDVIRRQAAANRVSFEEQLERTNAGIPSGRTTTPEEVANAIAFLLTDAAASIVGESLKISGGAVLRQTSLCCFDGDEDGTAGDVGDFQLSVFPLVVQVTVGVRRFLLLAVQPNLKPISVGRGQFLRDFRRFAGRQFGQFVRFDPRFFHNKMSSFGISFGIVYTVRHQP